VWRIVVGLSLIPAFGTLYQRLTLPESTRFLSAQKLKQQDHANEAGDDTAELKKTRNCEDTEKGDINEIDNKGNAVDGESDNTSEVDEATAPLEVLIKKKAHFSGTLPLTCIGTLNPHSGTLEFVRYFSEWRHGKMLLGTCMCWFLLDVACVSTLRPRFRPLIGLRQILWD